MTRFAITALTGIYFVGVILANAPKAHPGAEPFTPTRIDWLTTTLAAGAGALSHKPLDDASGDVEIQDS